MSIQPFALDYFHIEGTKLLVEIDELKGFEINTNSSTSIIKWKIAIGSSRFTLKEQATEFNALLKSTGDGPWSSLVGASTGTLWQTCGYNGSTATLKP